MKHTKKDERIHVIHQESKGVSFARNTGIEFAHGNYICFIDSDDYVEKTMIQHLYEGMIEDNRIDIVVCGVFIENGQSIKKFPDNSEIDAKATSELMTLWLLEGVRQVKGWLWSKMFTRDIIINERIDTRVTYCEDLEFLLRLMNSSNMIRFINTYEYHYNYHSASSSHKQNLNKLNSIELLHNSINLLIDDSKYVKYRFIKDYIKEIQIIAESREINEDEKQAIVNRNIKYIRKNMVKCLSLMTSTDLKKCLLLIFAKSKFMDYYRKNKSN